MTAAQVAMVQRALDRATREGVRVIGSGTRHDGRRVYAVSSASEPNRAYVVTVLENRLACECAAAKDGRYCKHRAVAHARLREDSLNAPISIFK
jgi:hypothetical protein